MSLSCRFRWFLFSIILLSIFTCRTLPAQSGTACDFFYIDDFTTSKVVDDCEDHAVFWPEGAFPPPEPYLVLSSQTGNPPRGLMFVGFGGLPAHLSYCFSFDISGQRLYKGTIEFDVMFPGHAVTLDPDSSQGYLMFSLSIDGYGWTESVPLSQGHHTIELSSPNGTCYIMLLGTMAAIDNIKVCLQTESAVLHVPDQYPTIQDAVNAVSHPEDVIEVAPGVYTGPGNRDVIIGDRLITPAMIYSRDGAESTTIDCGAVYSPQTTGHRAFYIVGPETKTIIKGFNIINGYIPGDCINLDMNTSWLDSASNPVGGGIFCEKSSPSIVDCVFRHCGAEAGGGIGCVGGAPHIAGCLIEHCRAGGLGPCESGGSGGGIALLRASRASVVHCEIRDNMAYWNSRGGGIFCHNGIVKAAHCHIHHNRAEGNTLDGGGVYYLGNHLSRLTLQNCLITRNYCHTLGGGVYAVQDANWSIDGFLPIPRIDVFNCTIAQNHVHYNSGNPFAGGVYADQVNIQLKNSILWYNEGQETLLVNPAANSPVNFCNIEGGYPGGSGNINSDPLFASLPEQDYHLKSLYGRYVTDASDPNWTKDNVHSPSIDAGDSGVNYFFEPTPNGQRINMGAYGNTSEASKGVGYLTYHVDVKNGKDNNTGLDRKNAFETIKHAVNVAKHGDYILVWPGVYRESVRYLGKALTIQSAADAAVIHPLDLNNQDKGVDFSFNEDENSVLKNFVIRGADIGIRAISSSPTISHVTVVHCRSGVEASNGANPRISNSIFWYNDQGDLLGCSAEYSCIQNVVDIVGTGNISIYPRFADPQNDDYHLLSERGRFLPVDDPNRPAGDDPTDVNYLRQGLWILDNVTSPCIDQADPAESPRSERMPNGGRLNMGAYGGTAYASMSEWPLPADFNRDGIIDLYDSKVLSQNWLNRIDQSFSISLVNFDDGVVVYTDKDTLLIEAQINGSEDRVDRVQFFLDGELQFQDLDSSDGWAWESPTLVPGLHVYVAQALMHNGVSVTSPPVVIEVTAAADTTAFTPGITSQNDRNNQISDD